jgi:hypothetical protein
MRTMAFALITTRTIKGIQIGVLLMLTLVACHSSNGNDTYGLTKETLGIPITQAAMIEADYSNLSEGFTVKQGEPGSEESFISYKDCPIKALLVTGKLATGEYELDLVIDPALPENTLGQGSEALKNAISTCPFETRKGIRLGSSEDDVLKAYGSPNVNPLPNLRGKELVYRYIAGTREWEMSFTINGDKEVESIWLAQGPKFGP